MTTFRNTWIMRQTWEHLLFAHWPVSVETLRKLLPAELEVDTFDGQAWIGIIPFQMSAVRLRFFPEIPFTSRFPEVNLRTYVTANGRPGVFFLTLDASNPFIVNVARWWYHLPYFTAKMSFAEMRGHIHFSSERNGCANRPKQIHVRYAPLSAPFSAKAGSLEHWLMERYRLYCRCPRTHRVYHGEIYHKPWELQTAQAELTANTLIGGCASDQLEHVQPLLHYARGVEALIWPVRRLSAGSK